MTKLSFAVYIYLGAYYFGILFLINYLRLILKKYFTGLAPYLNKKEQVSLD